MSHYQRLAEHKNTSADYHRAKKLRHEPTSAEQILWRELRLTTKNQGFHFRRQHPLSPYIVDFVCLKLRLIVEVDGASHDTRLEHDRQRDADLKSRGYETMRFTHDDVVTNRAGVVMTITNLANERMKELDVPHP